MTPASAMLATVLVPTHDHGPLLACAVQSALDQTVRDLEILIVGDGMDEATRQVARDVQIRDPRVKVFDFPKAPRHGETSRTKALASARGDVVLYLSDDDLWLPGHVEGMAEALRSADFAHCVPVCVTADQRLAIHVGHFAHPEVRARLEGRWNFIPLSAGAHTRALYDRLPEGWVTAPEGTWTDLHMWRRLLSLEGCRPASGTRATLLHFASPERASWSMEQRVAELSRWTERIRRPGFELELARGVLDLALRELTSHSFALEAMQNERDALRAEAAAFQGKLGRARERVAAMEGTITWRLRARLLARPRLAAVARKALRPFHS